MSKAKVSNIFECPRCSAKYSGGDRPKKCTQCSYHFEKEKYNPNKLNWTIDPYRQMELLLVKDLYRVMENQKEELPKLGFKEEDIKN